jgi:hypothetical protein
VSCQIPMAVIAVSRPEQLLSLPSRPYVMIYQNLLLAVVIVRP